MCFVILKENNQCKSGFFNCHRARCILQYRSLLSVVQLLMLELNIGCDEAFFCRLMLVQYTAAVSQDPEMEILILVAAEVMNLAA